MIRGSIHIHLVINILYEISPPHPPPPLPPPHNDISFLYSDSTEHACCEYRAMGALGYQQSVICDIDSDVDLADGHRVPFGFITSVTAGLLGDDTRVQQQLSPGLLSACSTR